MMRGLAALRAAKGAEVAAWALLALLLLVCVSPLRAAPLSGNFDGIGEAANMVLTLQQAERRVVGRLAMSGAAYTINGERAEVESGGAQGVLRFSGSDEAGQAAFFHLEERPLGLQFLFIPAAADGTPDLGAATEFSFLRRGVMPKVPATAEQRYTPAPPDDRIDILDFLDGFRAWHPRDTARLYASLDERDRALILLYDHATAELMWRLCEAAPAEATLEAIRLAEMQERQQTDCASYLPYVEAARQGSLFPEFLRRSLFQLELVRATVLCGRGETAPARCADVSALGAPLILRWRRADAIMAGLLPPGQAVPTPATEEPAPAEEPAAESGVEETPGEAEGTVAPEAPLPLARPGGNAGENPGENEEEFVSDFEPDAEPAAADTPAAAAEVRAHRLPLARPR